VRFSVETWAPEYGAAIEPELEDVSERVDVEVERSSRDWAPIEPRPATRPDRLQFVDGVRRIDARVWIHRGDLAHAGVCASVAAGLVDCDGAAAVVTDVAVRRVLLAPTAAEADAVATPHGVYDAVPTASDDPGAMNLAIHGQMTDAERSLVAARECDVVVFDGPLRGRQHVRAVGYVKTQHVQYLPSELMPTLGLLADGDRTPLVRIGDRPPLARWSCYLRLPGPRSHPLSGVVRIELPGALSIDGAIARADVVTSLLPRFASAPHKEPRAPQNLTPIAGLEHRLRHLLGDPLVLERALRRAAVA
jgi:hypothetical protein